MLKLHQIITGIPTQLEIILPLPDGKAKINYTLEFLRL
jgi:hypothetical protein